MEKINTKIRIKGQENWQTGGMDGQTHGCNVLTKHRTKSVWILIGTIRRKNNFMILLAATTITTTTTSTAIQTE